MLRQGLKTGSRSLVTTTYPEGRKRSLVRGIRSDEVRDTSCARLKSPRVRLEMTLVLLLTELGNGDGGNSGCGSKYSLNRKQAAVRPLLLLIDTEFDQTISQRPN